MNVKVVFLFGVIELMEIVLFEMSFRFFEGLKVMRVFLRVILFVFFILSIMLNGMYCLIFVFLILRDIKRFVVLVIFGNLFGFKNIMNLVFLLEMFFNFIIVLGYVRI